MTTGFFVGAQTLGKSLAETTTDPLPTAFRELATGTVGVTLRTGLLRSLSRQETPPDTRDLSKAIADTLRAVVQSASEEVDEETEQDALTVLAPSASTHWKSLFKAESGETPGDSASLFSDLTENAETETSLTTELWQTFLRAVCDERQIELSEETLLFTADQLHTGFSAALRRLLLKDQANGNKAYPGLTALLRAEILAALPVSTRPVLPTGTVTFLFTDLEGSTQFWERYPLQMRTSLMRHDALMRQAVEANSGHVFKQAGDAFFAVFDSASDAVGAALTAQRLLNTETWDEEVPMRVRMGLHTGEAQFRDNDYFGATLNRVSRLMSIGHGGQVLLSGATAHLSEATLPEGASLKDMGLHRLKDIQQPEHVYQLRHPDLREEFPPLRSQNVQMSNLPSQLTSFVGRSQDIAEVKRLLKTTRLLTLTGGGGSGKTRLALQVASVLQEEEGLSVWMAELENVRDPSAVPAALALALNIQLKPGTDLHRQVIEYLRPLRVLLLLDNFEQVADAAPFVNELLRECPDLICLITSRELLRISGEVEYLVLPLSTPPSDTRVTDWTQFESVQLFQERCQAFKPDFALSDITAPVVGELCRRLDGIPLAIELAAARMRGMTPQQILQRLSRRLDLLASTQRDLPERQRTLRGAIDWSYDLLNEDERTIFSELAVFAGGFFLEAAEEVCMTVGAFDAVFSLRDKSLLKTDELDGNTRYTTLESVRDYALEKLQDADRLNVLRERHADYYLRLAQQWSDQLAGDSAAEAMQSFRLEIANMREGMDWAVQQGDADRTIAYAKALFTFLRRRGLYEEGDARLRDAQEEAHRIGDLVSEARLLNQRGLLAWDRSDLDRAQTLFMESYTLSEQRDDKVRMLVTGINMGNVHWGRALFRLAREQWEQCLALAVATEQPRYEGMLRTSLGILSCYHGEYAQADAYFEAARTIQSGLGNTEGVAYTLYSSSELYSRQGNYTEAIRRLEESLALFRSLGHRQGIAETFVELGRNSLSLSRLEEAEDYLERGLQIAREIDDRRQQMNALEILARLRGQQGQIEESRMLFESAYRIAYDVGDRKQMAETLHHYGSLLWANGEAERGYVLLSLAERECSQLGLADAVTLTQKRLDYCILLGERAQSLDAEAAALDFNSVQRLFASLRPLLATNP